ncbi:hypothetical protein JW921_07685 [Candidatus Fermentibacterales bacterium]|nr:hypothetical protein [Candidatus Fermentibacterales bacterium]
MNESRIVLMVFLYMLCTMPIFVWALLWAGGMLGGMDEGTFRTVLYVLIGAVLVMLFVVMPFLVVPRILNGPRERERQDDADREGPTD